MTSVARAPGVDTRPTKMAAPTGLGFEQDGPGASRGRRLTCRLIAPGLLSLGLAVGLAACEEPPATSTPTPISPTPTPTPRVLSAQGSEPSGVYEQSPWWPYLSAHVDNASPADVIGGPLTVRVTLENGGANWAFPGTRELDPTIFGDAENPKGTDVPAIVLGVPEQLRETLPDGTQRTSVATPFSDRESASTRGSIAMTVVDATAIDGATTKDRIDFEATFEAPNGQGSYRVVVEEAAPHGWFIPTAGGVITNFIHHGVTGWGSRLMPTVYTDVAFWGLGDLYKDGELLDRGRLVHVMVTEFVREAPYDLVFDEGVNPDARHLHLLMPPITPFGDPSPVSTGYTLPNGVELPFLHVMFPDVQITAERMPLPEARRPRELHVTASSFQFEPRDIEVVKGQPVKFVVQSTDTFHTFSVKRDQNATDDLFSLDLVAGETETYVFVPKESGTLYLYCKPHHALGMVGVVRVVE